MNGNSLVERIWDLTFVIMMLVTLGALGNLAFRTAVQLAFIAWTLFNFRISNRMTAIVLLFRVLFILWCACSSLWAINSGVAFNYVITLMQGMLLGMSVLIYASSGEERRVHLTYTMIVLGTLLMLLIVLRSYSLSALFSGKLKVENRIRANGLNPNIIGVCASYSILLILGNREQLKKIVWVPLVGVLGLFALLTGSRKAVITIIIGIFILNVLDVENIGQLLWHLLLAAAAAAGIIFLIFKVDFLYETVGYRIENFLNYMGGEAMDKSANARVMMIQQAKEIFSEHPILGIGLHNYKQVSYYQRVSHNNYYELLSCLGIIGFVLYYATQLWILVSSGIKVLYRKKEYLVVMLLMLCILMNDYAMVSYSSEIQQVILMSLVGSYVFYVNKEGMVQYNGENTDSN